MSDWTITYDPLNAGYNPSGANIEQSLAEWGVKDGSMKLRFENQATGGAMFSIEGVDLDVPLPMAVKKLVLIRSGRVSTGGSYNGGPAGTRWMLGIITEAARTGSGEREELSYKVADLWWFFENWTASISFQQIVSGSPAGFVKATETSTHFILNRTAASLPITTGQVIEEMINLVIANGAPMALLPDVAVTVPFIEGVNDGSVQISAGIGTALYSPSDEVNTITVMECLRKMFRWTPDIVAWFDYSTDPPTFHCQQASNGLGSTELALLDGGANGTVSISSSKLTPRYDLLRPFVLFKYEVVSTVNGAETYFVFNQQYPSVLPTGLAAFQGLTLQVSISGMNLQETDQTLTTTPVPVFGVNQSTDNAFLASHAQWLSDGTISSFNVNSVTVPGGSAYSPTHPYAVLQGGVCPWMADTGGNLVKSAQDVALFNVDITYTNGQVEKGKVVRCDLTVCTLNTGGQQKTFIVATGYPASEPIPPNMAEEFYDAVNVLQYDGTVTLEQEEAAYPALLGTALSFTDDAQYAGMLATVQSYEVDVSRGTTTVRVGPNRLLTLSQMVDLYRVVRSRLVLMPASALSGSPLGTGSPLSLADRYSAGSAAAEGAGYTQVHSASDNPGATNQNTQIVGAATGGRYPAVAG